MATKLTEEERIERGGTLLAGGCSFVWGDELDGYDDSPPSHWQQTFTHQLAKLEGMKPHIIAECGNGNDKIFRDIVDYISDPTIPNPEMVFVSWSAFKRIELYEEKDIGAEEKMKIKRWQNLSQFSPERFRYLNRANRDIAELWSNLVYNQETGAIHMVTYATALQTMCDALGIKIIQTVFHNRMGQNMYDMLDTNRGLGHEFGAYMREQVGKLRPECRLGFYNVDKDTGLSKEEDWYDMYTMSRDDKLFPECRILEYMHPCEITHRTYAEQIQKIIRKYIK